MCFIIFPFGIKNRNRTKSFWDYESEDGDFFDTSDGENLENYKVLMRIIGKAKEG